MLATGDVVGAYRIVAPLGEGGMGLVYVAEHTVLGRRFALKVLHPDLGRDAAASARFLTEARAVARIGHEHIVDVTHFGTTAAGDSYFVMELLHGESLGRRLAREGSLPLDRALKIAVEISGALTASHEAGIIHRDIKPDNVFLVTRRDDADYVKLLDFGLAKSVEPGPELHRTKTGIVMGTPHYMSPEQWAGSDVDHRTDVYALGVMLYRMVTGALPFQGKSWGEICVAHMTLPFPNPSAGRPDFPADLERAIMRATEKSRADRWPTMAAMGEALRLAAKRLGPALPQPAAPEDEPPAPSPPVPSPRDPRLNPPTRPATGTPEGSTHLALASTEPAMDTRARRRGVAIVAVLGATVLIASAALWMAVQRRLAPVASHDPAGAAPARATPGETARAPILEPPPPAPAPSEPSPAATAGPRDASVETGVIGTDAAVVRERADAAAGVVGRIGRGTKVTVLERRAGWSKVQWRPTGGPPAEGWVHDSVLGSAPPRPARKTAAPEEGGWVTPQ